jgi:plastocyanin
MTKIFVLATIGLVVAVTLAGAATAATPTLTGTVGPGFTITLTTGGKKVTKLNAGRYQLVVRDRAAIHNFVLEGPGVERDVTTVPFKGTKTVSVKLRAGKYKFYCRPHESSMFGFVKVT